MQLDLRSRGRRARLCVMLNWLHSLRIKKADVASSSALCCVHANTITIDSVKALQRLRKLLNCNNTKSFPRQFSLHIAEERHPILWFHNAQRSIIGFLSQSINFLCRLEHNKKLFQADCLLEKCLLLETFTNSKSTQWRREKHAGISQSAQSRRKS